MNADLRIYDVSIDELDIVVALYGGSDNACGSVKFNVSDGAVRGDMYLTLLEWKGADLPVLLEDEDGVIRLSIDKDTAVEGTEAVADLEGEE